MPSAVFVVWRERETRADGRQFIAYSPEHAAEKWAREYDQRSAEYSIVKGQPEVCWVACLVVRANEDSTPKKYLVRGHSEPTYDATPVP